MATRLVTNQPPAAMTPEQEAEFRRQHPFAPAGWNGMPTMGAAPATPAGGGVVAAMGGAPAAPAIDASTFEGQNRLANAGVTLPGTFAAQNAAANNTGVVLPAIAGGDVNVQAAKALAYLNQPAPAATGVPAAMGGPRPAAPVDPLAMQPGVSGALARVAAPGVAAIMAGGGTRERSDAIAAAMGNLPPAAMTAVGLDAMQGSYDANRAQDLLRRNGALPAMSDAPEVFSNKMGYLRQLALQEAGLPVASGVPAAMKTVGPDGRVTLSNREIDPMTGKPIIDITPGAQPRRTNRERNDVLFQAMAGAGRAAISSAMTKPKPGSAGYKSVNIEGVGTMVVDGATGEPVPASNFTRPDRKTDEKALTQTEIQQLGAIEQSARDLQALEDAFKEIGDPNFGGPVAGRLLKIDPRNPNVSRIVNLVTAATPNLARGVFREVGVLTDSDVARYQALLPNVTDTAKQRAQKLADLRSRLAQTTKEQLDTLKAAGRDVTGLQEKILGTPKQPAAAKLAPGDITPEQARAELQRRREAAKKGGR